MNSYLIKYYYKYYLWRLIVPYATLEWPNVLRTLIEN